MFFKKSKHKIENQEDVKNSKNFCMAPWVHAYILPDLRILPCCVSPHEDTYGDLTELSFEEGWNSSKFRAMRKLMLEDRAVYSCEYCITLEQSNVGSLRQTMNDKFLHHFDVVKKTKKDGSLENPKLRYFDVRFSNLCNFKCRGCSPTLSTQWFEDHEKLWDFKSKDKKLINAISEHPRIWEALVEQLGYVEEAYFAGGEPLMMDEHYKCLEILIASNRVDVMLSYNTNLSVLRFKKYDLIEMWKKFKNINLMISLDDIGEKGEYFRKGLDWEKWQENIQTIKRELPHVSIRVTCTVTMFNVHRIPAIHSELFGKGYIGARGFDINPLINPEIYRCQVLPQKSKNTVKLKLEMYVKSLLEKYPDEGWDKFVYAVNSLIKYMFEEDRSNEIADFKQRTLKLDKIRDEDFKAVYPELAFMVE